MTEVRPQFASLWRSLPCFLGSRLPAALVFGGRAPHSGCAARTVQPPEACVLPPGGWERAEGPPTPVPVPVPAPPYVAGTEGNTWTPSSGRLFQSRKVPARAHTLILAGLRESPEVALEASHGKKASAGGLSLN